LNVPQEAADVPDPVGTRAGDRAVGGSNLYHDVATLETFDALSHVTGKPHYRTEADAYAREFVERAQSPTTGLLAWGEHTYYDVFRDEGSVYEKYREKQYGGLWHELLADTPPWERLWRLNPARTKRAITGLRYHFFAENSADFLFNRHAHWDTPKFQKPDGAQPWVKHSALYAYSFAFLHQKTGEAEWLRWARGCAALYWEKRSPQTNLTIGCIGDPRPMTQEASLGGTFCLAYWLLKAYHLRREETAWRDSALTLVKSYDKRAYNRDRNGYHASLHLDGRPANDLLVPWKFGYGEGNITKIGRMTAYMARTEKDDTCLEIAKRMANMARQAPLPEKFVAESMGNALHLSLDLFDLTGDATYREDALRYAKTGMERLRIPGSALFARQTDDPFYEAKLGVGVFVGGLVRLSAEGKLSDFDWSV
jgi:hypothetical protein